MLQEFLGAARQLRCLNSSHKDCWGTRCQAGTGAIFTFTFSFTLTSDASAFVKDIGKISFLLFYISTHGWWTLATSTVPIRSCCTNAEDHLLAVGACAHHHLHHHHYHHHHQHHHLHLHHRHHHLHHRNYHDGLDHHIKVGLDCSSLCDTVAIQLQAPRYRLIKIHSKTIKSNVHLFSITTFNEHNITDNNSPWRCTGWWAWSETTSGFLSIFEEIFLNRKQINARIREKRDCKKKLFRIARMGFVVTHHKTLG